MIAYGLVNGIAYGVGLLVLSFGAMLVNVELRKMVSNMPFRKIKTAMKASISLDMMSTGHLAMIIIKIYLFQSAFLLEIKKYQLNLSAKMHFAIATA